jgi:hypothetical protein
MSSIFGVETVLTDIDPADQYQPANEAMSNTNNSEAPPGYPIPSDRSVKSAMVVPAVVVAITTSQYRNG